MENETDETWIALSCATKNVVTWIALIASTRRLDAKSQTAAEESEGCRAHDDVPLTERESGQRG